MKSSNIGGQAVLEGIMMRNGGKYSVAVRKSDGGIAVDVQDYNHVFDVRRDVQEKIADFLNPATGNYRNKGWEIGSIPNETQILNALKEVKDIYYIEGLRLDAKRRNKGGTVEVDLERAARLPYVLPLNGKHEVIVKVRS